jgi:hypothetical protein
MTFSISVKCRHAECRMPNVVMLSVIILSVIMLSVVMLSFVAPNASEFNYKSFRKFSIIFAC